MPLSIDQAEKESYFLVRFENEVTGGIFAAFTTLDSEVSFEGDIYESETRMTIGLPRNDGGLSEEPCLIGLPRSHQFAIDVTTGQRYPATRCVVIEVVKGEGAISTTVNRPFRGRMILARRKVGGKSNRVTISCITIKGQLQNVSLGLPCMQNCVNRLGDGACKVALVTSPRRITAQILSINGPEVTLSTPIPTGLEDRFYQRGSITKDGFEFLIRDWRNEVMGDRQVFFLTRTPPASWVGTNMVLLSGCDKSERTCDVRYSNLSEFRGPGARMLPYNPIFEDGSSRT